MNPNSDGPIALSLRLLKAQELARQGRRREAETTLMEGRGEPPQHPLALHALATLVTQSGDYSRARKLWALLVQRDPRHDDAQRMLAAVDLWLSRPLWVRWLPAAGALVLAGIIGLWWSLGTRPAATPTVEPAPVFAAQPPSPSSTVQSPGTPPPPAAKSSETPSVRFQLPSSKSRSTRSTR